MKLHFIKMQGCGNDYIYLDGFTVSVSDPARIASTLSDRHFGVGGDGLVIIAPPDSVENDARMRMFNADGSEGGMCGNAIRCVAKYVYESGICRRDTLRIETKSGIKTLSLHTGDGKVTSVTVDMGAPRLSPVDIPVLLEGETVVGRQVGIAGGEYTITCVSMGNPHCVVFCDNPETLRLDSIGPQFEHDRHFPDRVNTEFVRVVSRSELNMRVWERGSGETLACGTGACASVVAAVLGGHCDADSDVRVNLRGGTLTVRYTGDTVLLSGPCVKTFEGDTEI